MSILTSVKSLRNGLTKTTEWVTVRLNELSDKVLLNNDAIRREEQREIMHEEFVRQLEADSVSKEDDFNNWFETNHEEYLGVSGFLCVRRFQKLAVG